jgi:hypothetical protein
VILLVFDAQGLRLRACCAGSAARLLLHLRESFDVPEQIFVSKSTFCASPSPSSCSILMPEYGCAAPVMGCSIK